MAISRFALLLLLTGCASVPPQSGPSLNMRDVTSDAAFTVVYFWGNQCPCVKRYQTRIEDLSARYRAQGVRFVAVSSNSDDSEEKVKALAHERNFKLPILKDVTGEIADVLGARTTPTVVIVDKAGAIRFRGWIDNERYDGNPDRIAYLENALRDLVSGREVRATNSPIYGCRITKSLR